LRFERGSLRLIQNSKNFLNPPYPLFCRFWHFLAFTHFGTFWPILGIFRILGHFAIFWHFLAFCRVLAVFPVLTVLSCSAYRLSISPHVLPGYIQKKIICKSFGCMPGKHPGYSTGKCRADFAGKYPEKS